MSLQKSVLNENTIQIGIAKRLGELGWVYSVDESLGRPIDDVFYYPDLEAALIRLNPEIAKKPERAQEVVSKLRAVLLSVSNDGLVAANQEFVAWMCGRRTVQYVGTDKNVEVRLIDFDDPSSNTLRGTTEASFNAGKETRRYDNVLWVNGLPLVVGEIKSPVNANLSWLNAATDIHNAYEKKTPGFFVPNVLSFATEGKAFHYGAVGQLPEMWLNWGVTTDEIKPPGLPSVMRSVELLLTPAMVLDILRSFTLYTSRRTTAGAMLQKIIPRYPQVEAVEAIVARVRDPKKRQGLVWHHQGSGKTFAMAYAAAKLRHQSDLDAPTIVIVLDRLELIQQTSVEFASVGIAGLKIAKDRAELKRLLSDDARGVIITTIFRFAGAGLLNDRENIVVMVDEAHRTQEGRMGLDMREALPNAKFIGLTGTPISTSDRDTWRMFGDDDDPGGALNHYTVERSIYDGATLPVHVETRLVEYHLDAQAIQEGIDALGDDEELTEEQRAVLAKKGAHISVVVRDSDRVAAVCKDIVDHYRKRIAPLGLKGQVVAYDRATCVAYYNAISALLEPGEEAAVVMTTAKDDPAEWDKWGLKEGEEAIIKDRFRDVDDSLKLVIVTAKLLTGFDAPIEGVMYLDKPLRAHTLFQAVCRTNRRWTNPRTGQEKRHGLVVDYVGMGKDLAKALAVRAPKPGETPDTDTTVLLAELEAGVRAASVQFAEIDQKLSTFEQIFAAQGILDTQDQRDSFAAEFMRCQGLFEFLWPDTALRPIEDEYSFLAKIYASIAPDKASDLLLWHRLGAKTMAIVHEHLVGVTIDAEALEDVPIDGPTLRAIGDLGLFPLETPGKIRVAPTAFEVIERLDERIARRIEGGDTHKVWASLSERLELLRNTRLATAKESVAFLKALLELARGLLEAEKADDEGRLDEIVVINPRQGALTQIFQTYAPKDSPQVVATLVEQVDSLVQPVRGTGWQTSHPGDRRVRKELRKILKRNGLPPEGEIFDNAYNYIRENY